MSETLRIKKIEKAREVQPTWKNAGEIPITGLEHKGHPERKEICEDVKINDPDSGLFMVADGVSLASGWFASREVAGQISESLGDDLDDEVEKIRRNEKFSDEKKQKLIDALVRAKIRSTILEADSVIRAEARLNPNIRQAATTVSFVKLVEMSVDEQNIFLANIGDSRIFLMRDGRLKRLTEDDSLLTEAVRSKHLTIEEAQKIDQASSVADVPDRWKSLYKQRNQITNSVGGHGLESVDVKRYRVKPGDRLILASDGLTDQLKENEIEYTLLEFKNPREAERMLQQRAEKMSLDGKLPRSKGDDIAVVVHRIEEKVRKEEGEKVRKEQEEFTQEQVSSWRAAATKLQKEIQIERQTVAKMNVETKEGLEQLIALKNKEQDLAVYEYWISLVFVREVSKNFPPRFESGDSVNVNDRIAWIVASYDETDDRYLVKHPTSVKSAFVDRFTLELMQKQPLVRPNDVVDGLKVVGNDENDRIVLMEQFGDKIVRRVEDLFTLEKSARDMLQKARAAKKEMNTAIERINNLKSEIEKLTQKRVKILAK